MNDGVTYGLFKAYNLSEGYINNNTVIDWDLGNIHVGTVGP